MPRHTGVTDSTAFSHVRVLSRFSVQFKQRSHSSDFGLTYASRETSGFAGECSRTYDCLRFNAAKPSSSTLPASSRSGATVHRVCLHLLQQSRLQLVFCTRSTRQTTGYRASQHSDPQLSHSSQECRKALLLSPAFRLSRHFHTHLLSFLKSSLHQHAHSTTVAGRRGPTISAQSCRTISQHKTKLREIEVCRITRRKRVR